MKKAILVFAALALVAGCKEDKKDEAKQTAQKQESPAASTTAELGPCYKYMHCQADSEINYSGLSKSECAAKGGKSWKGQKSGCTEL